MGTMQMLGRQLSDPPSDGISNLRFSSHSDHHLISSWDKTVRLYDADADVLRSEFLHGGPVLDYCFHDDSFGFSACAGNAIRRLRRICLGSTTRLFAASDYSYSTGQVITGSWDKTIKCWDPRGVSV